MEATNRLGGDVAGSSPQMPGIVVEWSTGGLPSGTAQDVRLRGRLPSPRPRDRIMTAALERLVDEATLDDGHFRYEGPVSPSEIVLPNEKEREGIIDRSGSGFITIGFAEQAVGIDLAEDAFRLYREVHAFTGRNKNANTRPVLFEAPLTRWANDPNIRKFMESVRTLYGVATQNHVLRLDPEPVGADAVTGTNVYLAFSGGDHFLLVERSVLTRGRTGEYIILRRLEAADASSKESVLSVVNELSLREVFRVKQLLHKWGVPQEQRAGILEQANRDSVRSDADLRRLVDGEKVTRRHPWMVTISNLAATAIGKLMPEQKSDKPAQHRR